MRDLKIEREVAMSMLGVPYIWGGNNSLTGIDCSGFVLEILRMSGLWNNTDARAQDIYYKFEHSFTKQASEGAILFFGKSVDEITHVAYALSSIHMIEAGGGGSKTLTLDDAKKQNAMVRVRPISNRGDLVAICLPK